MDRKGIIAVALAIAVLIGWQVHYSREMQKYQQAKQAEKQAKAAEEAAQQPPQPAAEAPQAQPGAGPAAGGASPAQPQVAGVAEKVETVPSPSVEYAFTNLGGGIARAVLMKHVGDAGHNITLGGGDAAPIGAVTERPGEDVKAPFTANVNAQAGEVTFDRTDARQLQTTKKFSIPKTTALRDEYLVQFDLTFTNRGQQPLQVPGYFVHTGPAGQIHRLDQPIYTGVDWYRNGSNTFKGVTTFTSGGVLGFGKQDQPTFLQTADNVAWAGVTNQYFATIVTPKDAVGSAIWARKFMAGDALPAATDTQGKTTGPAQIQAVEGALGMPGFTLAPGQSVSQHFEIYAGPREYERLKALGGGQDEVMSFGMFKAVSKVLLASMNWLHSKVGSYAAAIIILTLIIRSLMWPLQNKANQSMKRMQALQPKMNELKEKYQDDPTRMNTELMKLYKDYGVNPVSGCLPMLVQIPIFFGFYNMLGKAVELRNAHFLWVNDLSQPDTVAHLFGFPINVLPLCMAVTMFWQMRISPKSGDPMQQRMFMFMPLIFVFFCYNFASALALYWTVQNIFSIVQLYITRNQATPALQKVSAPVKKKARA